MHSTVTNLILLRLLSVIKLKTRIMKTLNNYQNRLTIRTAKGNVWNLKRRYR